MTRIAPCVIAALALGLSACTNPYDPVQRGLGGGILGAASGAAIGGAAGGGGGGGPRRGHLGSGFWRCHWRSGGWRAGSRPRSSDRRGNRDLWGSRYYTSTPAGHL